MNWAGALATVTSVVIMWQVVSQRRRHPVVEIGSDSLVHYPPAGDPISIPINEITGVAWDSGNGHIGIGRRASDAVGLDVRDLSESRREALKIEIGRLSNPDPAA